MEGDVARLREGAGALPVWRAWLLAAWWRGVLRVPGGWRVSWWGRCHGSRPARCFVPTPGIPDEDGVEGYYRWGILGQVCLRWRGHQGECVAPINAWGHDVPGGAVFVPERAQEPPMPWQGR